MVDQTPADAPIAGAAFGGPPPASPVRPLPLRQMGIGELIDGSIKLYRRDWLALMGIVAFVLVPVTFVEAVVAQNVLGSAFEKPLSVTGDVDPAADREHGVLVARRTTYPVYFSDKPADRPGRIGPVPVRVRSLAGRSLDPSPRAMLEHESDGAQAVLAVEGMEPIPLAFHSPATGIDVGELRELGRSVPVLRLRPLAMDATIAFASRDDRDGSFATLTAATRR